MYHTGGGFYLISDTFYINSSTAHRPLVQITNTTDDGNPPYLDLIKNRGSNRHVNDNLGVIRHIGFNDAAQSFVATTIMAQTDDLTDGQEDGTFIVKVMTYGTLREWLTTANSGTSNNANTIDATMSGDLTVVDLNYSGSLTNVSDIALKENIQRIDTSIDKVKKLNPVTFDWVADNKSSIGFIAQDVEKVFPDIVQYTTVSNEEEEYKSIQPTGILAYVTKALQESIEKIETLEAQVKELQEA